MKRLFQFSVIILLALSLAGCACSGNSLPSCQKIQTRMTEGAENIIYLLRFLIVGSAVLAFMLNGSKIILSQMGGQPYRLADGFNSMLIISIFIIIGLALPHIFKLIIGYFVSESPGN